MFFLFHRIFTIFLFYSIFYFLFFRLPSSAFVLTFADLYSVRLSTSDRIKKNKENFEKEESVRKRKLQQQLHLNIKSHIINEFLINRSNSNRTNNNDYIVENDNYGKNLESNKSFNSYKKDFSSASSPHSIFNENEGSDKNKKIGRAHV